MFDVHKGIATLVNWLNATFDTEFTTVILVLVYLLLLAAFAVLVSRRHLGEAKKTKKQLHRIQKEKTASESRLAKMAEYMMPFMDCWPYDPDKFRFLGHPCDGIQFTDDSIIFVEIKTGKNKLSKSQKHLKHLVRQGNIRFATFRLDGDGWNLSFEDEEHD
jgi:predicted Holliday junction resolvase-like endonuclease